MKNSGRSGGGDFLLLLGALFFYCFFLAKQGVAKGRMPAMDSGQKRVYQHTVLSDKIKKDQLLEDMQITKEINQILQRDKRVADLNISVTTINGRVILNGVADHQDQIDHIKKIISKITEVISIESHVKLRETAQPQA